VKVWNGVEQDSNPAKVKVWNGVEQDSNPVKVKVWNGVEQDSNPAKVKVWNGVEQDSNPAKVKVWKSGRVQHTLKRQRISFTISELVPIELSVCFTLPPFHFFTR